MFGCITLCGVTKAIYRVNEKLYIHPKAKAVHIGALLLSLILTGCTTQNGQSSLDTLAQVVVPEVKVTDYRYAACEGVWENYQPNARENALFG